MDSADMNPYPAVKSWKIEVTPMGKGGPPFSTHRWTSPVTSLSCPNPNCKIATFHFTSAYDALTSSGNSTNGPDGAIFLCDGNDHVASIHFRRCMTSAWIRIRIEYA